MLRTSKGSIENSICDHLPFSDRLGSGNFLDVKKAFALRVWKQDLCIRNKSSVCSAFFDVAVVILGSKNVNNGLPSTVI